MSADILARLRDEALRQTRSDLLIGNFLERHLAELPFETAKSIARRVGVSPMTVGRYLRRLGFDGLEPLKHALRDGGSNPAWQVKDRFERLRADAREGKLLADQIRRQIEDLDRIYELTASPSWQAAVDALVGASEVYVAAWQNVRGIGQYFATQLSYTRPRVGFVDGLNGTYGELLDGAVENRCLFLFDVRRFAAKARPLAQEARRQGITVVFVTDEYCTWAEEAADICLVVPGSRSPLWDGSATVVAVLDLLISNIIVVLGDQVSDRVARLTRLQDMFGDFEK
ncbi:MurR/RpiR family transcriptional regulator [Geminicoccus roseus]|uniref:MurR/RpiR family transcriptional regulator n=1 Tax=Geminicoccus roseus TaxID=404900 RepID=UPI00040189E4|nr:MurR/RpiR family transcriptional regulator [Geminicoccus roseus]